MELKYIVNKDVNTVDIAPGVVQRPLVSGKTGSEGIFMGEITVAVGSRIPWHYHSFEDIILLREGNAVVKTCDEGEFREYPMEGSVNSVIIPPGLHHSVVNVGDVPLKIVFGFPAKEIDRIPVDDQYTE